MGSIPSGLPDIDDLNTMFDDLVARGLGEVYTLTVGYQGGSTSSVVRNSLTINVPNISAGFNREELPTTLAQGASATFRIERLGGTLTTWERLGVSSSGDPIATFGEVVLQNFGWNNANNSLLPQSSMVQKGYAFPVLGSNPNDGSLRQGLIDSGVSDRVIYDGDYVVWTADSFTNWSDGDNWFVISRNNLQRLSQEQSNFLAQTDETDNRVDLATVNMAGAEALVWLSENPLTEAPFINPSTDSSNPRPGDNYAYIGGREDRNAQQNFVFGQNRFNSYLTIGITPSFVTANSESNIYIRIRDTSGEIVESFNLATDFTFVDDSTFTNGSYRHYQRNTTFNYSFLETVEVWLTQVQRHFVVNPSTVDLTQNISGLQETQLSTDVVEKLNRALPTPGTDFSSIEERLLRYKTLSISDPDPSARFLSSTPSGEYPSSLTDFDQVSAENPRFLSTGTVLFVAVQEPGNYALLNTTKDTIVVLDNSEATVSVVESFSDNGISYFVFRITGITSGDRYEINRNTSQRVIAERDDISNLQDDVQRIDAELDHAVFDLPDAVVQVLENEVSVAEESTPSVVSTAYNNQLAGPANTTQTVFYESSPNTPAGGVLASKAIKDTSGDRARRKLIYFPEGTVYSNQAYLTASDGATSRDLITYANGVFSARVRVPAVPAGSQTSTVYPAPSTRVSGAGIWQNIPALTFSNGIPVPEADELFFTRNIPSESRTLNIQYRGHANGNVFGVGSTTLAGIGGSSLAFANFVLNDGSETANVEVRWDPVARNIRVSVTERVNTGFPTINDVEVILSYDETRVVPGTNAATRNVDIEHESPGGQVFAIKPSSTGNLIIVGDRTEIDTGFAYTTLFGGSEGGHLLTPVTTATYLDYEDFEPITSTITDLENHATLPQFGLFTTQYTHATTVTLGTQLIVMDALGNPINVGEAIRILQA